MEPPAFSDLLVGALLTLSPARLAEVMSDAPERAAPFVRAAAEHGLPAAQVRYGRLLLEGRGVARDEAAALVWFTLAGEAGDADGLNMVGRCHENGWGTAQDWTEAARWYRKAADDGCDWPQYNLGHLFLDGLGVARDPAAALDWYRRAAARGHPRAMNLVARCLEQGWGVEADPGAARDWYRRSAEGGYFRGQYNYASLLADEGRAEDARDQFKQALGGAPPDTRRTMAKALSARAEPLLKALGEEALA